MLKTSPHAHKHPTTGGGEPLGLVGYRNAADELVTEPFDPNNPLHIAVMGVFAADCPECQALLADVRPRRTAEQ